VLNQLIEKFVNRQWEIYQNRQLPFMQEQLAQARQKLERSRTAVEQYKAANGINSLEEERTLLLKQESDAQQSLTQAMSKQEEAQGRYQKLEEMLKTMPRDTKLSDQNDRFKAVDDNRQRVDDLLARQKQMSDNYRADSVTMKTLNAQLDFAQQQLAAASKQSAARIVMGANPIRQQTEIDLMTASGDQFGATASRASYQAALQGIHDKLSKLEAQSQQLDALTLQQQVDEENFRTYLQAVNDATVTDDLNRQRITNIAVIQSPTVATKPTRPRTKLMVPGAFLLGLAAAITVVLLAEMFDETFSTPGQIETVLGLPVLGTFTRRQRLAPTRALLAYGKMLPLVALLLAASVAPRVALGFDQLNPAYGQSLAVRDQKGKIIEILYPKHDRFIREGATGGTLGWVQRNGSNLAFFDRDGRQTSTASKELMPANYPIGAIAVVRDGSGTTIGVITRH
jgi:polysaccharide biosynthesis protein PslE